MELVKYQSTPLQQYKQEIIQSDKIEQGMSKVEKKVLNASLVNPDNLKYTVRIEELEAKELTTLLVKTLPYIVTDLGIRDWVIKDNEYEVMRLQSILQDHYSDLTYREFQLSFEYLMTGQLDDFLPKKNGGEPDRNHYQKLSLDFINKTLLAYRKYKNKIWKKANDLKATEKVDLHKEEINKRIRNFRDYICNVFEAYKETKEYEPFPAVVPVYELFEKNKLVDEIEITEQDRQIAIIQVLKTVGAFQGAMIRKDPDSSIYVKSRSKSHAMNRAINQAFDRMIEKNIDLRKIICF